MISDHTYRRAVTLLLILHFTGRAYASVPDSVQRADQINIAAIEFFGLNKTKPATLERELQVEVGNEYDREELNQAIDRTIAQLKNLNLFNDIDIVLMPASDSSTNLMICQVHVIEKWYLWPLPFVEFADRNFNQWWQFDLDPGRTNFGLYLFKYNFRGLNQTVKLSLVTGYTHNYGLTYNVPFTQWNKKVGYYFALAHRTNREVWYKTENNKLQFLKDPDRTMITRQLSEGSLYYRFDRTTTVFFNLGYDKITVSDSVVLPEANPGFLADGKSVQRQFSSGLSLVRENRDNRLFPWKGSFYGVYASSTAINNTKTILNTVGGKAAVYHPFRPKWSITGAGVVKLSNLKKAPYYNFKSLGYSNYVRGYENYVIEGQHFVLLKSGLRFALLNEKEKVVSLVPFQQYKRVPVSIYLDAFMDAGYVVNNSGSGTNNLQNTWMNGVGIGLNMAFYYDKVFRFELTRNSLDQYGVFIHFDKSF